MEAKESKKEIIRAYLKEARRYPCLSRKEEVELGKAMIGEDPEEAKRAKIKMVKANLRLVIAIAGECARRKNNFVILPDLIQDGNEGLLRAVETFDYRLGKFSTYASEWIRQNIRLSLIKNYNRVVRLPVRSHEKMTRLSLESLDLEKKIGRRPTPKELSEKSGVPFREVVNLFFEGKEVSLNAPIRGDEDEIMSMFASSESSPEDIVIKNDLAQKVRKIVGRLSHEGEHIINERFGLSGKERTLEDVSRDFGFTRERVRQIESSNIMRLRKIFLNESLEKEFVGE